MTTALEVPCPTCEAEPGHVCTLRSGDTLLGAYSSADGPDVDGARVVHAARQMRAAGQTIADKLTTEHADELPAGARFVYDGG